MRSSFVKMRSHCFDSCGDPVGEDARYIENFSFPVEVLHPEATAKRVVILLHGLNERFWDSYRPWADQLSRQLDAAVILFPIAYHMQRCPDSFVDFRRYARLLEATRDQLYGRGDRRARSLSCMNYVLSSRIRELPQRSLFAGIQTITDIEQLVTMLRYGGIQGLESNATLSVFAYSIGATIAQVLFAKDERREAKRRLFSESRLFCLCGGGPLLTADPVHKAILDASSFAALGTFFEALASEDPHLRSSWWYEPLDELGQIGLFAALLSLSHLEDERAALYDLLSSRMMVAGLKEDTVFPCSSLQHTGTPVCFFSNREPRASHLDPFACDVPLMRHVLDLACRFLSGQGVKR